MSDNDSDFGAFLGGFVIGGLVGAAVALVLAPQSGKETRSQISGRGNEFIDATEQRYQSAVGAAEAYATEVGDRASEFGQEVENQARIILDAGRESANAVDENGSASMDSTGEEVEGASS
jgi:gas vesicle protein